MREPWLILALAGTLIAPCVPRAQQTSLDQQAGALVVGTDAFFASQRSQLVAPTLLKNDRFRERFPLVRFS